MNRFQSPLSKMVSISNVSRPSCDSDAMPDVSRRSEWVFMRTQLQTVRKRSLRWKPCPTIWCLWTCRCLIWTEFDSLKQAMTKNDSIIGDDYCYVDIYKRCNAEYSQEFHKRNSVRKKIPSLQIVRKKSPTLITE